jgi:hypothetical protein
LRLGGDQAFGVLEKRLQRWPPRKGYFEVKIRSAGLIDRTGGAIFTAPNFVE